MQIIKINLKREVLQLKAVKEILFLLSLIMLDLRQEEIDRVIKIFIRLKVKELKKITDIKKEKVFIMIYREKVKHNLYIRMIEKC